LEDEKMNDFPAALKSSDIEAARLEALQNYKTFCADNPLLAEIQEAKSVEELKKVCLFARSLSIFLAKVDIPGERYDYASYLECLASAVQAKDYILCGAKTTPDDYELVAKFGIE